MKILGQLQYRKYFFYGVGLAFVFSFGLTSCRRKDKQPRPSDLTAAKDQPLIRVLLLDDVKEFSFDCAEPVTVSTDDLFIAQAKFSLPKNCKIQHTENGIGVAGWICDSGLLRIVPDYDAVFSVEGSDYRGQLWIFSDSKEQTLDAVNVLGVESYLAGVIGAEMPSYWEPAALQAQAIAARTYCLYVKRRFGAGRHWDLRKTAANQVYRGVGAETRGVWQAIIQTEGKVLTCYSSNGIADIFPAYYSSTCAGHTESSKNVFGDEYKCMEGVRCQYCKKTAQKKLLRWEGIYVDKAKVNELLMQRYPQLTALENIAEIEIAERGENNEISRIVWIKLTGTNGKSNKVRGEDFRLTIDPTGFKIKSTAFELVDAGDKWGFVNGRGLGHGVGMCQSGAQGMARKGKDAKEILEYYYPGTKIAENYRMDGKE